MKSAAFELTIPEALELDQAFQVIQGQRCSIVLSNSSLSGCEVDLYRSNAYVGTWSVEGNSSILITEEVLSVGVLTFERPEQMNVCIRFDVDPANQAQGRELKMGFKILVATAAGKKVHATNQAPIAKRIVAKMLDLCLYWLPAAIALKSRGGEPIAIALVSAVYLTNVFLVVKQGQTLGKLACGIRLAKLDNEDIPNWVHSILMRSFLPGLILAIPGVGFLFALADVMSLGRKDQRCLHDLIADTRVLRA